jgi:hypothetical protein
VIAGGRWLPATGGRWHPTGSRGVDPCLVGRARRRSWRALGSLWCLRSKRWFQGAWRAGIAGNVEQAVRRVHGRRVQHLVPARAWTGIAGRLPGAAGGRADPEGLAVKVLGSGVTLLVGCLAPWLCGVR